MMASSHLNDAALIAHLDEEWTQEQDDRVKGHLNSCITCRRRHQILERRSLSLTRWFAAEDQIPLPTAKRVDDSPRLAGIESTAPTSDGADLPRRLYQNKLIRTAAVLAVFVGAAMSPLRAVVSEWVFPTHSATPEQNQAEPTVYRFTLDSPRLVISIVGDAIGRVVIRVDEVDRAAVTILEGDGSEEVVLRNGRLELRGGSRAGSVVHVTVPDGVAVSVAGAGTGGAPEWYPGPNDVPRQWTIDVGA